MDRHIVSHSVTVTEGDARASHVTPRHTHSKSVTDVTGPTSRARARKLKQRRAP